MRFWRKAHKWLGFLVAIQILLWISGGVIMSVFPIDKVRGQHLIKPLNELPKPINRALADNINLANWQTISWQQRGTEWMIKATDFDNNFAWLDPGNGQITSPLIDSQIKQLASLQHANGANITSVEALQALPFEVRHLSLPMYQVNFDDWINSTFYIHPQSGQIASVRSDIWRLYDFFWMLHIMDYEQRDNFNNPLLIIAAICSLAFTFSGLILVYFSIIKPWYARVKYRIRIRQS